MTSTHSMVVGWYHSHPDLGVSFSGTDRATQRVFFNRTYSVGLVVDPVRGEEAWFIGPDSVPLKTGSVVGIAVNGGWLARRSSGPGDRSEAAPARRSPDVAERGEGGA